MSIALAPEVVKVAYQIVRGLKYVHSAHVVHRDMKPLNVRARREDGNCRGAGTESAVPFPFPGLLLLQLLPALSFPNFFL